jgi:hypothetical protein
MDAHAESKHTTRHITATCLIGHPFRYSQLSFNRPVRYDLDHLSRRRGGERPPTSRPIFIYAFHRFLSAPTVESDLARRPPGFTKRTDP